VNPHRAMDRDQAVIPVMSLWSGSPSSGSPSSGSPSSHDRLMTVRQRRSRRRPQQGVALVTVLVVLMILSILTVQMVQHTVHEYDRLRSRRHQLQCDWLVRSAVKMTRERLNDSVDYQGERWVAMVDEDKGLSGDVTIAVERVELRNQEIRVVAIYPRDAKRAVRIEKRFAVDLGPNLEGER